MAVTPKVTWISFDCVQYDEDGDDDEDGEDDEDGDDDNDEGDDDDDYDNNAQKWRETKKDHDD